MKLLNIVITEAYKELVAIIERVNMPNIHIRVVSRLATINPSISNVKVKYTQWSPVNSIAIRLPPRINSLYTQIMQEDNIG